MKSYILMLFVSLLSMFGISAANATAVDLTSLTASVDFSTTIAAVLLVFAALAGVAITMKAGRVVLRALGF